MKVKRSIEKYAPGLGAKIREARKADKRSVETLCGLAEVSRVYWYDIENEKIRDSLPELDCVDAPPQFPSRLTTLLHLCGGESSRSPLVRQSRRNTCVCHSPLLSL